MYELHLFVLAVQKCLAWLPVAVVIASVGVCSIYAFTYSNAQFAGDRSGQAIPKNGQDAPWHQNHRVRNALISLTGMCVLAAAAQ